jgi:hypothetical protein
MSNWVPDELRRAVVSRANGICEYCLISERDTHLGCEVDHIVSEKHGGRTVADNLANACFYCNRYKGTNVASLDPDTGDVIRLFNPRVDAWSDHFRLRGGRIEWKTRIGEATARILGFNFQERIIERELLRADEKYPSPAALARIKRT